MWYTFSMKPFLFLLAALVALALGFFVFFRSSVIAPGPAITPDGTLTVESPQANSVIYSPLTVTGKARGNWYFEAVFPIYVTNASGIVIGQGQATATGDWMSSELVPFKAEISFPQQSSGTKGEILFKNDNPSGLPEFQRSFSIPIQF